MEVVLSKRIISLICLISAGLTPISRAENNTTNIISSGATNAGASYVVGQSGQFNYLEIRNGAGLTNGTGYIGYTISAANNNAVVTGAGSRWINTNDLYVGFTGPANHLTITNGGVVTSGLAYISGDNNSTNTY
jgi:T5SS/PEP-CTERM-associated repeat protein